YDFDGDGKADIAWVTQGNAWMRSTGSFWTPSGSGWTWTVPGDYDGNGRWEPAAVLGDEWQTSGGRGNFTFAKPASPPGGNSGPNTYPVPGDYDGDGDTDAAWYRETDATWWIEGRADPVQFGAPYVAGRQDHDLPVPADYDGDGDDDLATYSPATATF